MRGERRAAVLVVVVVLGGLAAYRLTTGPRAAAPSPRPPVHAVQFDAETRAVLRLALGTPLRYPLSAPAGSSLRFWMGFPKSEADGFVHFQVQAAGRTLYEQTVSARRQEEWKRVDVPVGEAITEPLELTLERGRGRAGAAAGPSPELAVTPPRVCAAGPPGRVLVWISQDTLRADHLPTYGGPRPTAPHLTALAAESVVFAQAWSTAPWTLASLASQFTSLPPSAHGAVHPSMRLAIAAPSVFEVLQQAGFTVIGATGNTFVGPEFGTARGFDALRYTAARADVLNQLVRTGLDDWCGGDLALFVHYMQPHAPYVPPPEFLRLFDRGDPGPDGTTFANSNNPGAGGLRHVEDLYDAEIAYADAHIGALVAELKARGLWEKAVVVHSSDHGEELLEHGSWGHGGTLYEEVLHVPFLLRIPGTAPRRVERPVTMLDLAPTILAAFGLPAPASFRGTSLLPLLAGGSGGSAPVAETDHTTDHSHRVALRQDELKYLAVLESGRPDAALLGEELFALGDDPRERHNLAAPARTALWRSRAAAYTRAAQPLGKPMQAQLSAESIERLRALGYIQ